MSYNTTVQVNFLYVIHNFRNHSHFLFKQPLSKLKSSNYSLNENSFVVVLQCSRSEFMINPYFYYIFYSAFIIISSDYFALPLLQCDANFSKDSVLTLKSQQRSFVSENSLYLMWKIVMFNVVLQEEISGICNFCVSCLLTGTE